MIRYIFEKMLLVFQASNILIMCVFCFVIILNYKRGWDRIEILPSVLGSRATHVDWRLVGSIAGTTSWQGSDLLHRNAGGKQVHLFVGAAPDSYGGQYRLKEPGNVSGNLWFQT